MNVFCGIHKLACSGNISVFGSSGEGEPPAAYSYEFER